MYRYLPLFAVAALCGCVPVTQPIGDVEKAEPEKNLIGEWAPADKPETVAIRIDQPEVKGNPKGLMRMWMHGEPKSFTIWFFVATVAREKYGSMCLYVGGGDEIENTDWCVHLHKEGMYAKWAKNEDRRYIIFWYSSGKDELVINFGEEEVTKKVMKDEGIGHDYGFKTPAGWLAKYLEKNGREKLFPANKDGKAVRLKKQK
jgi:hypothetical protein